MLEAIGLSSTESRIYTALIDNPRSTASQLAQQCDVSAGLAARALASLARRGMVSRLPGRRARYVAVAPDTAIQPLLSRRESELLQVRTAVHELVAAFHQASRHTHPAELVEIVTGTQNIADRAFALQDSARTSLWVFDKLPYAMRMGTNENRELRRLDEGIEYRVLYERRSLMLPGRLDSIRESAEHGEVPRVLPELPMKLWISDAAAALVPLRTTGRAPDTAFVVYPSALLDALVELFRLEWERAAPIRFGGPSGGPGRVDGEPDETTRALLTLLAAGLTDEGMARTLGLSLRTLQRRIHAVMAELNATTRFQAGMAAKERGWL